MTAQVRNARLPVDTVRRNALAALLLSVALGTAAFLADAATGILGSALLALTSSGFSWGLAALLIGFRQQTQRGAAATCTALLLGATASYYLLVLGVSQRWRGGHLDAGTSADILGLLSVGRAAAFWAVASLCAGPIIGFIAWRVRSGSDRESAAFAGLAFGLFSAEGLHTLAFKTAWILLDDFGVRLLVSAILTISLSALTVAYIVRLRGISATSRAVIISAGFSAILGLALWRLAELARMAISV
ncbi:DUF6518 family protein [Micromonospora carbonacea]